MHEGSEPAAPPSDPGRLLRDVAFRIRSMREAKGWTRGMLARRAGLSLRFLARVEAGDGNISLLRLADLAAALGVGPEELLRSPDRRPHVVALVGLRGAGKSTVGPLLAERLGAPFLEMEALVREASGLPLDQLFELHGEAYYRRLEREIVARVLAAGKATVLAAAGGVVNEPPTWDTLLDRATVVWLRARPEDHWTRVVAQGDRRPMADNPDAMAELRAMLVARERVYAQSHVIVDTAGLTPSQVVEAILERIGERSKAP